MDEILVENIRAILTGSAYRFSKDVNIGNESYSFWKIGKGSIPNNIYTFGNTSITAESILEVMGGNFTNLYKEKELVYLLNKVLTRKERVKRLLEEL